MLAIQPQMPTQTGSKMDVSSLQGVVQQLVQIIHQEPMLQDVETKAVLRSLQKAIAPTFEIVFAGAFSAGKSMLINALLERELLYSAEGHATGTECQIAFAEADRERVVLTFLSEVEIQAQVNRLAQGLGLPGSLDLRNGELVKLLVEKCGALIEREGGESKSERAKQASALRYLVRGWLDNRDRIAPDSNRVLTMEEVNFSSLQEAASYARRGSNSAVLKRVEYYCHHPLLQDGNILVDTPGIDAPVQQDAALTYEKIADPETSAVICVLKAAAAGDMTSEETVLLEMTRGNLGIRDRVFYVFNRVDETWYNAQLRQRLADLIQHQFRDSARVFQTSALLGFYGSQVRATGVGDRFGLDSIFAEQTTGLREGMLREETPQFVNEFNRYCASSGRLPSDRFRVDVRSYESPNGNYVRILQEQGSALVDQLLADSGVEAFREAVTRYLLEEKRPLLLANLAEDLQPVCGALRRHYLDSWDLLKSQPKEVEGLKEQALLQLGWELQVVGDRFREHVEREVNTVVAGNGNEEFEADFWKLKTRLVGRLDELLNAFSVGAVHQRAQTSHRRNSVVPLLGILAEAFYYLANGLEEALVEASQELVANFFGVLNTQVRGQDYYRQLQQLIGEDAGVEGMLKRVEKLATEALVNEARVECDRYVRERPEFFAEGTTSVFQLRQTLMQACMGYDYQNMVAAEPAIRQLLKLDFEEKVGRTVMQTFRQTVNQTLNVHLLGALPDQVQAIVQKYDKAREFMGEKLEQEAADRVRQNLRSLEELEERIRVYNESIRAIGSHFNELGLECGKLLTLDVKGG
jgi:replication fork clamp-binding protein CrfC